MWWGIHYNGRASWRPPFNPDDKPRRNCSINQSIGKGKCRRPARVLLRGDYNRVEYSQVEHVARMRAIPADDERMLGLSCAEISMP
jgi:hypothetical protein